ncbi:MAG: mechanosensitive ion channel family protein [Planctomycetes bacterium]|nr:mechanosensitive ion channel family protein [Planctomycetota bacterium]
MEKVFWGNPLSDWLIALSVALGTLIVLSLAKALVIARLSKLAERTETDVDDFLVDLVRRTKSLAMLATGIWGGSRFLELKPESKEALLHGLHIVLWIQAGFWGLSVVNYLAGRLTKGEEADPARAMGANILGMVGRSLVWLLVGLQVLSVLMGQPPTALLTGLGVSGIAVALALQNVLGDLFASIAILLDKPFIVGDFIIVGDFLGTVERIGIKTTRLKSLTGEQIVMGNADLVNSRVRNFKRMKERRVLFTLGVTYQTSAESLEQIPGIIRTIIEGQPKTRFERAHFKGFGSFSLDIETVYHVLEPDYAVMMDTQQKINLAIFAKFAELEVEFAYPTQTVFHVPVE